MFLEVVEVKQTKNRLHPDLPAPDWAARSESAVSLGATHSPTSTSTACGGRPCDPEGNEFDIGAGAG